MVILVDKYKIIDMWDRSLYGIKVKQFCWIKLFYENVVTNGK